MTSRILDDVRFAGDSQERTFGRVLDVRNFSEKGCGKGFFSIIPWGSEFYDLRLDGDANKDQGIYESCEAYKLENARQQA